MNDWKTQRGENPLRARPILMWLGSLAASVLLASLAGLARDPRLIAQYYLVSETSSSQSFRANSERISILSPQWFTVDTKGNVESAIDSNIVRAAKERGVPLMPLVLNQGFLPAAAHVVLDDPSLSSRLIHQLINIGKDNHFFGYQLDFENTPAEDGDRYADFVHRAAQDFRRSHLRLSVAVPAPLSAPPAANASAPAATAGWIANEHSSAFQTKVIARDVYFVSLMTYDEYALPGEPGPIAGLPWVEACIHKTLESVPARKLMLGVPLYFRDWSGKTVREGSIADAYQLAEKMRASIALDPTQGESFFTFSDGQQGHTVWLEDNQSLNGLMNLADRFNLAGISAWRLGFEDPKAWDGSMRRKVRKVH